MTTTVQRDLLSASRDDERAPRGLDEEHSIGQALRVTLLFLAVMIILVWAGITEAQDVASSQARIVNPSASQGSSPTLR
jgi:hypothetical protein